MDLSGSSEVGASDVATIFDSPSKEARAANSATATAAAASAAVKAEHKPSSGSMDVHAQLFAIEVDHSRDALLTDFGKDTLTDRYLLPGESYQDLFVRVASAYADDQAHAQRIYDYISRLWFMPSTPVLSNGGTGRGLPGVPGVQRVFRRARAHRPPRA